MNRRDILRVILGAPIAAALPVAIAGAAERAPIPVAKAEPRLVPLRPTPVRAEVLQWEPYVFRVKHWLDDRDEQGPLITRQLGDGYFVNGERVGTIVATEVNGAPRNEPAYVWLTVAHPPKPRDLGG